LQRNTVYFEQKQGEVLQLAQYRNVLIVRIPQQRKWSAKNLQHKAPAEMGQFRSHATSPTTDGPVSAAEVGELYARKLIGKSTPTGKEIVRSDRD
jgi:hypothetical protein